MWMWIGTVISPWKAIGYGRIRPFTKADFSVNTERETMALKELKYGIIYDCRLSGRQILIESIIPNGDNITVYGVHFNAVTGRKELEEISDYQLFDND